MPRWFWILLAAAMAINVVSAAEPAQEVLLYDFEDAAVLKGWSHLELPGAAEQEPAVKLAIVANHATAGKSCLKLTFAGGQFPTVTTADVLVDWLPYPTFKADVTVDRPGFMLHGDSRDYITAHTREAAEVKQRPAVLVIYDPK